VSESKLKWEREVSKLELLEGSRRNYARQARLVFTFCETYEERSDEPLNSNRLGTQMCGFHRVAVAPPQMGGSVL